jgi:nucleotide-binding universal stress UspA family protein
MVVDIGRILCPVDLSAVSRHAVDHALALARWYEARLTFLYVSDAFAPLPVPPTSLAGDVTFLPPVPPDVVEEDIRTFCGPTPDWPGGPPSVVVKAGRPVEEIVRAAEDADLLVMGTHGRSGFERLFLGSVTEKVLRTTHRPVLTVPPPVEQPPTVLYKTILCPIEFSSASLRALEYALSLAEETDARLILLHVIEGTPDQPTFGALGHLNVREYYRHLEEDALARLKAAVPDDARVWCRPYERVMTGKAYREILSIAAAERVEVIVMGVHGKGLLHVRLFGSTTHHVIREATCPVLTLRG